MGNNENDHLILSYKDTVLWGSDLDILRGPHFLNDRIIDFGFALIGARHPSHGILLVSSAVSFWAANCLDTRALHDVIEPLDIPTRKLVLFPVNNNDDVLQAEGGTHWSLLAFDRDTATFSHYDSFSGTNRAHAMLLYSAVSNFVRNYLSPGVEEVKYTPQQTNGYDCGLYVLAIAEALCQWKDLGEKNGENIIRCGVLEKEVTPAVISPMRSDILESAMDLIGQSPSRV